MKKQEDEKRNRQNIPKKQENGKKINNSAGKKKYPTTHLHIRMKGEKKL